MLKIVIKRKFFLSQMSYNKQGAMNCKDFAGNIIFYLDEELPPEVNKAFDNHLSTCTECRQLFDEVAATYATITAAAQMPDNPFFYHKVKAKLNHELKAQKPGVLIGLLKPLAAAASIALGIMIGNGEIDLLLEQDNEFATVSASATLAMPADYSVWTTLNEAYGSEN